MKVQLAVTITADVDPRGWEAAYGDQSGLGADVADYLTEQVRHYLGECGAVRGGEMRGYTVAPGRHTVIRDVTTTRTHLDNRITVDQLLDHDRGTQGWTVYCDGWRVGTYKSEAGKDRAIERARALPVRRRQLPVNG